MFVIVTLACLPAAWPALQPGFIDTRAGGDSPFLLIRLHQLLAGLDLGFPVRWMPDAAYGLGYPFWNFYAPLPYYLAAVFSRLGLGYIAPIKLVQLLGFLVAAWGMYALARSLWASRAAGMLAALAYTYAPFHLVNVYVRGDSLGEFWAFAFYPLTWLTGRRVIRQPSPAALAGFALAYAGLILSHNISALIFSPFLGLYLLLEKTKDQRLKTEDQRLKTEDSNRQSLVFSLQSLVFSLQSSVFSLQSSVFSLCLSLALSAWFWYPALAERGLVQLEVNLTGFFSYTGHFRDVNLVQPDVLFNYDPTNGAAFALGLAQVVSMGVGVFAVWRGRGRPRGAVGAILVTLLVALVCITPLSRPLWDATPLLPFAQFPWRFLSVVSFAGALLAGAAAGFGNPAGAKMGLSQTAVSPSSDAAAGLPNPAGARPWIVAGVIGSILAVTGLARLDIARLAVTDNDVTAERIAFYEIFTSNIGTTIRGEYLPRAVTPRPYITPPLMYPEAAWGVTFLKGMGQATQADRYRWAVNVTSAAADIALPVLAFPGWRAYVNNTPASTGVAPGLGYLTVALPTGSHTVDLRLERSAVAALGESVSIVAVLILIFLLIRDRRWVTGLSIALAVGGGLWLLGIALRPTPVSGPLVVDFIRYPWLQPVPEGVRYAHGAHLTDYHIDTARPGQPIGVFTSSDPSPSDQTVAVALPAGQTLNVMLNWNAAMPGRVDVALVSLAEHIFGVSYQIANERTPIEPTTAHRLEVPADTPPGLYWLRIRVQDDAGEEVTPLDPAGRLLGRLYLRPVYVTSPASPFRPPPSTTLSQTLRLSEGMALVDVQWEQRSRRMLDISLVWECLRPVPDNYVTSIRLLDAQGQALISEDQPPGYGFLPTSAWRAGQFIQDRRRLSLPGGLAGGVYRLDLVLYQRATLTELGRAQLEGVRLESVP